MFSNNYKNKELCGSGKLAAFFNHTDRLDVFNHKWLNTIITHRKHFRINITWSHFCQYIIIITVSKVTTIICMRHLK